MASVVVVTGGGVNSGEESAYCEMSEDMETPGQSLNGSLNLSRSGERKFNSNGLRGLQELLADRLVSP